MISPEQRHEVSASSPEANRVHTERQLALQAMAATGNLTVPRDVMMGVENRAKGVESPINGSHKIPVEQTTGEHQIVVSKGPTHPDNLN